MAKIWVTGSTGMLASDLVPILYADHDVFTTDHEDCDVTDLKAVEMTFADLAPDIIVNCAAYTKVDAAEAEPGTSLSHAVNAIGPKNLANVAAGKATLIHISTDYVFDGSATEPYSVDAPTNPMGTYAKHKLEGEQYVQAASDQHLIIRTSALFGVHGVSFPTTMYRLMSEGRDLKVVDDQQTRPTYTPDLADAIVRLIEADATGIVHVANHDVTNWFDYAKHVARSFKLKSAVIERTTTEAYGAAAPRPKFAVLDTERYEKLTGHTMRSWKEAFKDYVETMKAYESEDAAAAQN